MNAVTQVTTGTVLRDLAQLGTDPDAIADRLTGLGITGMLHEPGDCAIARYLTTLPGVDRALVGGYGITIRAGGERITLAQPAAIRDFRRRFDNGLYPQLVAARRPGGEQ